MHSLKLTKAYLAQNDDWVNRLICSAIIGHNGEGGREAVAWPANACRQTGAWGEPDR